jgi:hypothetical protein
MKGARNEISLVCCAMTACLLKNAGFQMYMKLHKMTHLHS